MILILLSQNIVGEEVVSSRFLQEIKKIEKPLYPVSLSDTLLQSLYRSRRFSDIIRIYSDSILGPEERLILGEAYYYTGEISRADSIFSNVLRESKDSVLLQMALLSKGWVYYRRNLYHRSADIAGRIDLPELKYHRDLLLALSSIGLDRYSDAFGYIKDYETPEALLIQGYTTYSLGNYDMALKALHRLYELYPSHPLAPYALMRMAIIYIKTGFVDDAIRYLNLLLDEYPHFELRPQVYLMLASTLFRENRYEELADVVPRFLKEFPSHDYVERIKDFLLKAYEKEQFFVDETYPYYHLLEGYRNYRNGKCAIAVEHFGQFLKGQERRFLFFFKRYSNDPFVPDALLYAARCYRKMGEPDVAISYLKKCSSIACKLELAEIYIDMGKFNRALKVLKPYEGRDIPLLEKGRIYLLMGIAYRGMGDKEKAKQYMRKAELILKEAGSGEDIKKLMRAKGDSH